MTQRKLNLPRDRVVHLRLEGLSWDEIGREMSICAATAETTYRMAELILAEDLVGIHASPMLREPREADCLPLRDDLEDLLQRNYKPRICRVLLRMLNHGALSFSWFEQDDRPIRIWSTSGGVALMDLLDQGDKLARPATGVRKGLNELEHLEQFIMGNFVFTTDSFEEIQLGGRTSLYSEIG